MVAQAAIIARRSAGGEAPAPPRRDRRVLGPAVLSRGLSACGRLGGLGGLAGRHDWLALYLPTRSLNVRRFGLNIECPAKGALLLDIGGTEEIADDRDDDGIVVLLPRRTVSVLLQDRVAVRVMEPSLALASARRLAARLLDSELLLSQVQAILAGRALSEFVAAALTSPTAGASFGVAARREASLLDRLTVYADDHLAADLDVAALCAALACSRSALYRATSPVGGVAARVNERRLEAVHARLCDPAEQRCIAAVARAHGLTDPAAFSRSFKRRFGFTAADLRRREQGQTATPRS